MSSASHEPLSWLDMSPVEFDTSAAPTAKARRFAQTAADTLFPRLMPDAKPAARPAADQLPGQDDLFGGTL
jgi:hypothetical protein